MRTNLFTSFFSSVSAGKSYLDSRYAASAENRQGNGIVARHRVFIPNYANAKGRPLTSRQQSQRLAGCSGYPLRARAKCPDHGIRPRQEIRMEAALQKAMEIRDDDQNATLLLIPPSVLSKRKDGVKGNGV